MSCIPSITTVLSPSQLRLIGEQKLRYTSPPMRDSLLRRLKLLALSPNPKIRERAALDYALPAELQLKLSRDPEDSVRSCLARNRHLRSDVLRALLQDPVDSVRGFAVLNPHCPSDILEDMADNDPSETVRHLISWRGDHDRNG